MKNVFCPKCRNADFVKLRQGTMRQDFEKETIVSDYLIYDPRVPAGKSIDTYQLSLELHECSQCQLIFAIGEIIERDSIISTVDKLKNNIS